MGIPRFFSPYIGENQPGHVFNPGMAPRPGSVHRQCSRSRAELLESYRWYTFVITWSTDTAFSMLVSRNCPLTAMTYRSPSYVLQGRHAQQQVTPSSASVPYYLLHPPPTGVWRPFVVSFYGFVSL